MPRKIKVSKNAATNWRNDSIQFPRLIAELEATGALVCRDIKTGKTALDLVAEEMDLDVDQVCSLVSRAQDEWDRLKAAQFKARAELD